MAQRTTIQVGIGGDKVQRKNRQRQAKTKSESRDSISTNITRREITKSPIRRLRVTDLSTN